MPFTVEQLIENREPVAVCDTDPVKTAQHIMVENQFSQLPVIDKHKRVLGLITSDSILRALNTFSVPIDALRVLDAMDEIKHTFREDDDVFDLLDDLIDASAVLIVDSEHVLKGIVTSYDTTQYFRQRAEDMMHAEDIETFLKDYINAYFTDSAGNIDEKARLEAITAIMPSNQDLLKPFKKALTLYMQLQSESQLPIGPDYADQAFTQHLYHKESTKPFDQLTQNHYIDLFLHNSRWSRYSTIFSFDRNKIRTLLDDARTTRNDAAHFRTKEITAEQRERLKFCRDWLARHQAAISDAFQLNIEEVVRPDNISETSNERPISSSLQTAIDANVVDEATSSDSIVEESRDLEIAPVAEVSNTSDSRYAPLAIWLQNVPLEEPSIVLSFNAVEKIIGDKLPASARKHRAWWSNYLEFSPQARQWWDAGWRVSTVRMTE
jgi:CBS domain-containing protein